MRLWIHQGGPEANEVIMANDPIENHHVERFQDCMAETQGTVLTVEPDHWLHDLLVADMAIVLRDYDNSILAVAAGNSIDEESPSDIQITFQAMPGVATDGDRLAPEFKNCSFRSVIQSVTGCLAADLGKNVILFSEEPHYNHQVQPGHSDAIPF